MLRLPHTQLERTLMMAHKASKRVGPYEVLTCFNHQCILMCVKLVFFK